MPDVKSEARKVQRLIARYLSNARARRVSPTIAARLRREIKASLVFLDQNAIHIGDSEAEVKRLLGPAPGHAGPEAWLYPGANAQEAYRIEFQSGAVAKKYFTTLFAN